MFKLKFFLSLFLIFSLFSCALKNEPQPLCRDNLGEKKPLWIDGERDLKGFYTGAGFAAESDIKAAKIMAMQDLSENISSKINSFFQISSEYNISEEKETYRKNTKSFLKIESQIRLNDLKQDAKWVDSLTCGVWVRLKIEKRAIDNLIKLNKAKKLYSEAGDIYEPLALRMKKISQAINIILCTDFSALPKHIEDKNYYLSFYRKLKNDLRSRIKARRIVYAVNFEDKISKEIRNYIALKIMKNNKKGWYDENFLEQGIEKHLEKALNNDSEKLVLININKNLKQGLLYEAILNISVSVYDVKTGVLLSKPAAAEASIFASHKRRVNWFKIADKIFEKEPFKKPIEN